jgi:hypothetical protein
VGRQARWTRVRHIPSDITGRTSLCMNKVRLRRGAGVLNEQGSEDRLVREFGYGTASEVEGKLGAKEDCEDERCRSGTAMTQDESLSPSLAALVVVARSPSPSSLPPAMRENILYNRSRDIADIADLI